MSRILNYLLISDRLGTAGQPTADQFADIRAAGYKVVINLAMPDSTGALPDEETLVTALGMDYVHIPVVWEGPTLQDLARFFEVMEQYRDRKVFVHCAMNMRVSAFVFLYRVLHQGVPIEEARQALNQIWEPDGIWQALIELALEQPPNG
jgi:protein tyrosine phosphatase (PTP) superfamily phosphohydrolase (DUF442 family)